MIKDGDLEPLHQESLDSIWSRSPYHETYTDLKNELKDEINSSYLQSVKHSIVDYILMDESEKQRLSITKTPEMYQPIVVRSPVPWSVSFTEAKEGFYIVRS